MNCDLLAHENESRNNVTSYQFRQYILVYSIRYHFSVINTITTHKPNPSAKKLNYNTQYLLIITQHSSPANHLLGSTLIIPPY